MKFKVNDLIIVTNDDSMGKELKGHIGRIVSAEKHKSRYCNGFEKYGIEFDEYINGHSCGGKCKDGHGWYAYDTGLELVQTNIMQNEWVHDDVESLYTVDKTTTVTLTDGSVGESTCHPCDIFNLAEGYLLAYSRAKIESHNKSMEKYYRIEEIIGG